MRPALFHSLLFLVHFIVPLVTILGVLGENTHLIEQWRRCLLDSSTCGTLGPSARDKGPFRRVLGSTGKTFRSAEVVVMCDRHFRHSVVDVANPSSISKQPSWIYILL